jgi:hypothetical protein
MTEPVVEISHPTGAPMPYSENLIGFLMKRKAAQHSLTAHVAPICRPDSDLSTRASELSV